jgi:dihydrofolate reductase
MNPSGAQKRFFTRRDWRAIVAFADNGAMGAGGKIPWHFSEDLRFFKEQTTGHTIVMGRKTWDSIGRPLPNRTNIVLSHNLAPGDTTLPGAIVMPSLTEVFQNYRPKAGYTWIIGGAHVFELALPGCMEVIVTHVHGNHEGDVFFPRRLLDGFFSPGETLRETPEFHIVRYRNSDPVFSPLDT